MADQRPSGVDWCQECSDGWGLCMEPKELERLWSEHLDGEFGTKDVEATLATMVDDASINHMPVNTGGRGKRELRAFYRDVFIPSWPDDLQMQPINRVVGDNQLVDELHASFTHSKQMDWFLPGVAPTNRKVEVDFVVVVQFRDDRIACERIYWDHATVLRHAAGAGHDRGVSGRSMLTAETGKPP